eukprot:gene62068-84890_t
MLPRLKQPRRSGNSIARHESDIADLRPQRDPAAASNPRITMIKAWLDLSATGIFAALCLLYFGAALALAGLTFRSPLAHRIQSVNGVVADQLFAAEVAIDS